MSELPAAPKEESTAQPEAAILVQILFVFSVHMGTRRPSVLIVFGFSRSVGPVHYRGNGELRSKPFIYLFFLASIDPARDWTDRRI
jgi:hypothetical protein